MTNWKSAVTATLVTLSYLLASCTQVPPRESTDTQVTTDSSSTTVRTGKEYEALTAAYEKVQTDLTASQTQNRDLQAEYDKMKIDLGAAQTQSKNLQAESEKAKTDLSVTLEQNKNLQAQYDKTMADLATAQMQNRNLKAEHEKVGTDLSAAQTQNKNLQAQYDKIKADLTAAETQNKNLQAEYEKVRTDLGLALDKIKRTLIINNTTEPGVTIEQGNIVVTLHSFSQYKETDSYYIRQLRSGYGYYVADLTVQNNAKDKTIRYAGEIDTKVQTNDGFRYESARTSATSGVETSGDLPPKEKARFVVSFAIPQTSKPAKLIYEPWAGTGATVLTFELGDKSAPAPTTTTPFIPAISSPASNPTPTETPEQFKALSKIGLAYSELLRNTELYVGQRVFYKGRVLQVSDEKGQSVVLRVYLTITAFGTDITTNDAVWVNYTGPRVLEGDTVQFWGIVEGRRTYTAISFKEVTIPEITAKYLDIVKKLQ